MPFGFGVGFAIDESLCAAEVVESDGTPGPFTEDGGGVKGRDYFSVAFTIIEHTSAPLGNSAFACKCPEGGISKRNNNIGFNGFDFFT